MFNPEQEHVAPAVDTALTLDQFAEVFRDNYEQLVRLAGAFGYMGYAEDNVQEAAVKVVNRMNKPHLRPLGVGGVMPYAKQVVRRQVIDSYRAQQSRGGMYCPLDEHIDTMSIQPDFSNDVLPGELLGLTREVLSESHAEIIELTILKGHSVPEASKILNIPLGTAKSRVYYALRALRQAAKDGVFDGYEGL